MFQAMTQAASQDVNKIILLGKAGGPAQIGEDVGSIFADFSISTATKLVGRGGQIGERVDVHDIEAADDLVEIVRELAEGDRVYVEGELCTDEVEREGQPGQFDYFTRVCARVIIVIGAATQVAPAAAAAADTSVVAKESKPAPSPEPEAALVSAAPVPPPADAQINQSRPTPTPAATPAAPAPLPQPPATPVDAAATKELKPWQRRGAAAVRAS